MLQVRPSCIKGGVPGRPGSTGPVTRILAHRGDARSARENTLDAFAAAAAAGADGVELDVRRCADGALVVHHDAALRGRALVELALRELPGWVPTLEEALSALEALFVNVEVKNGPDEAGYDPTGALAHAVAACVAASSELDRVVVSSFDLATVAALRQANPAIPAGLLLGPGADLGAGVATACAHGLAAVHPFVGDVSGAGVAAAHARGLEVAVWTVDTRADLTAMLAVGVDTVITDDVALALELRSAGGLAEAAPPPLE